MADTFISTDNDGIFQTKAQFLADSKDPAYAPTLVTNSDERIFLYENAAVVARDPSRQRTLQRGRPFDHYGRFTDTSGFYEWKVAVRRQPPRALSRRER